MRMPLLSLVIATVHRTVELEACLTSLLSDGGNDFEVIVVDQNNDRRLDDIMERFRDRLRLVHVRRSILGASMARNAGAEEAQGKWLTFPDDDCRFLPDTLRHFRGRASLGTCDLLTGMTRNAEGQPSVLPWFPKECNISKRVLRRTVAESTLFLRRDLFFQCNGFDPTFGPGGDFCADEAIDLIRRIMRDHPEARLRFVPGICVIHADRSPYENAEALRKARAYARGRGACFARHWRFASKRRIVSEVTRHMIGSVVLRGLRRQSRVHCLLGYLEGFRAYRRSERGSDFSAIVPRPSGTRL